MAYKKRIVLSCPNGYNLKLDALVEDFIKDEVSFVGVVGKDCDKVEDIIDELVVGDGSDESRFILTSSHPGSSIEEVVAFAKDIDLDDADGSVEIVIL